MHIFLINLDRHALRLERMKKLLAGVPFERVAAVDGKTLDGPEHRDPAKPQSPENISRYEIACIHSHRAAWNTFLAGREKFCCVLEDDIFLGKDFAKFFASESWIPGDGDLIKMETFDDPVFISRKKIPCFNRVLATLHSLHFGTAGYVVSRRGAAQLLEATRNPGRTLDRILFDETAIQNSSPIYQLVPALCVQGRNLDGGIPFPEMESSIDNQPKPPKPKLPPRQKILRELRRPFRQFRELLARRQLAKQLNARCKVVPFA